MAREGNLGRRGPQKAAASLPFLFFVATEARELVTAPPEEGARNRRERDGTTEWVMAKLSLIDWQGNGSSGLY